MNLSEQVSDFPRLLQEIGRILRPDGLFLSGEWGRYVAFDSSFISNPQTDAPGVNRFWNVINSALETRGLLPVAGNIPLWLHDSGQFKDITAQQFIVPIGRWPQDASARRHGKAMRSSLVQYAEAFIPMLKMDGWEESKLDDLLAGLVYDLRNVRGLVGVFHTVYARKV